MRFWRPDVRFDPWKPGRNANDKPISIVSFHPTSEIPCFYHVSHNSFIWKVAMNTGTVSDPAGCFCSWLGQLQDLHAFYLHHFYPLEEKTIFWMCTVPCSDADTDGCSFHGCSFLSPFLRLNSDPGKSLVANRGAYKTRCVLVFPLWQVINSYQLFAYRPSMEALFWLPSPCPVVSEAKVLRCWQRFKETLHV